MKYFWGLTLGLVLAMLVQGCAGGLYNDGYDTYLDANGDVVRAYPANYDKTIRTGTAILEKLDAEVFNQRFERSQSLVEAKTPGGSLLRIRYIQEGRNLTVVRVRTGPFGYPNREYSNQFHAYLDTKLKRRAKRTTAPTQPKSPKPRVIKSEKKASVANTADAPTRPAVPKEPAAPSHTSPSSDAKPVSEIAEIQNPPGIEDDASPTDPEEGASPLPTDEDIPADQADAALTLATAETALNDSSVEQNLPGQRKPDYIIFFEKDSNVPTTEALEILDEAVKKMQINPDAAVELEGYADTEEDPEALHLVSEGRSLAVKSYLIGKGIESHRIHTAWHGSRLPDPPSERNSQNRRVEIRLSRGL